MLQAPTIFPSLSQEGFQLAKYIIKRVLLIIPVVLGAVILVFTINYFNDSSPALTILGSAATPEKIAIIEEELGLDRPYFVQLGEYLWNIVTRLDFGESYSYGVPCTELIAARFPITAILGLLGVCISVVIGVSLGILAAVKQYTVVDYGSTLLATVFSAVPNFWLAMMLMLLFSVKLRWLPVSGLNTWKGWILPLISISIGPISLFLRMTRSSILEVIRQDYVRTARAKGLSERRVISHHVIKNGMIPVATVIGIFVGMSMTGTIMIEKIFNISGLGLLMYGAINTNDYILLQGCVIVCAVIISTMTLITDIAYAFIDPRIRAQYTGTSRQKAAKQEAAGGEQAA